MDVIMRKAILKNKATGVEIEVYATTEHPDSSYGKAVWVDKEGIAYLQVDYPFENPFYEIIENVMTMTLQEFANLINSADEWKTEFNEIIELNGWNDETAEEWGVCSNDTERIMLDDEGKALVIAK